MTSRNRRSCQSGFDTVEGRPTRRSRSRGLFVAMAGPDGSGKSTIVRGLAANARTFGFTGCQTIQLNFGILPRIRDLGAAVGLTPPSRSIPRKEGEYLQGMAPPKSVVRSVAYLFYYWLDFLLGHMVVRRARKRGVLLLADRYFYDYYFQRGYRRTPHFLLRLLSFAVPEPDILLVLEGDPDVIHGRKPELSVEEIAREIELLNGLVSLLPCTVRIRADVGVEAALEAAVNAVLAVTK